LGEPETLKTSEACQYSKNFLALCQFFKKTSLGTLR